MYFSISFFDPLYALHTLGLLLQLLQRGGLVYLALV